MTARVGPTAQQRRLMTKFNELQDAGNWRGVAALEREGLGLSQELGAAGQFSAAGVLFNSLGIGLRHVGDYTRARKYHEQDKAICEVLGDRAGVARACSGIGSCYERTGDYGRARELHEQDKAFCEALGDRAGVARACSGLGNCSRSMGDFAQALELHEQHRAMAEELGDRAGVATACTNLGNCYRCTGDYARARKYHEQHRAIVEALGDRVGAAVACANIANCYRLTGDYARAREMHEQHRAMAEEMEDRAGVACACASLGNCYQGTGDYARAREMHEQHKAIREELGDRAGVAAACGNLGNCYACTGDYATALTFYRTQHAIVTELKLGLEVREAAMKIGIVLRLQVRADRQASKAAPASPALLEVGVAVEIHSLQKSPELNGVRAEIFKSQDLGTGRYGVKTATGRELALKPVNLRLMGALTAPAADDSHETRQLPRPRSFTSARVEDRVQEAKTWLKTAGAAGQRLAILHLAYLTFETPDSAHLPFDVRAAFAADREDAAIVYLQDYLCWCVARGRHWCGGCGQRRREDTPMLTCSGCRVTRFCSADHQQMASKRVVSGGCLWTERHKDICGLLGKWRGVEKDGVSPDALRTDLLAFLQQQCRA